MTYARLCLPIAMILAGAAIAAPPPASDGTLTITLSGLKTNTGAIRIALYDEADWDKTDHPIVGRIVQPSGGTAQVEIKGLVPGRYGMKAFHDLNGNGKLDTGFFGRPKEPYAFSNNAKGSNGPAAWKDAAFDVRPGQNSQLVKID